MMRRHFPMGGKVLRGMGERSERVGAGYPWGPYGMHRHTKGRAAEVYEIRCLRYETAAVMLQNLRKFWSRKMRIFWSVFRAENSYRITRTGC